MNIKNVLDKRNRSTKTLVLTAILTALVVALQLTGQFIRFGPFSISLVLIPIVIGGAICGPKVSTWLGLIFGVVVLLSDASAFLVVSVVGTVVTVLLKGILCGLAAGLVYKLVEKKNVYLAVVLSAIVCPIVNTGVFIAGCYIFFFETISDWGLQSGFGTSIEFVILGMVGVNFLLELATNIVLSPIIVKIINIRKKLFNGNSAKKIEKAWKQNDKLSEEALRWNRFIEEICNKDIDSLSEIQKKAVLCLHYDAEVNNGGHSLYFDCYPETNPQELIDAITEISYKAIADNFEKALYNKSEENFKEVDTAFYKFSPGLCDCLEEYVEKHKEEIFN